MRVHQTWRSLARTVALVLFSSLIFVESISCGGGGGGGITSQQARLGYVLGTDAAAGKTHSLAINSDGTLTPVPGSPFSSTGQPQAVAVSTSSRLAFIASSNGNFVPGFLASFRIGHDGVLSSLGAPVSPGIPIPLTISMPSAGSLLLVGGYGSAWAFAVDTTTGVVNALTSSPAVTFSPDGKFAFGVNGSYMNSYSIDGSTGQATLISSLFDFFELLATPPVVHPSGKFVYVPYESATIIGTPPPPGGIAAYAVATDGTLTPVPGMPFASGINFGTTTVH